MNKDKSFYNENDFEKFQDQEAPDALSLNIKTKMTNYVQPSMSKVTFKYSLVFVFAALVSLFLCPQKGFGFLEGQYPLFFHFLHNNIIVCGIYCGVFFGMVTHGAALIVLNHYERLLIRRKHPWVSAIWFAVAYFVFMLLGSEHYVSEVAYSVAWIATSIGVVIGLNKASQLKHLLS